MFESFTLFVALGIGLGISGFLILFQKYDFPSFLRRRFKLYTKAKSIGFALLLGIFLALTTATLLNATNLGATASQFIEGVAIGFNCAVLSGLISRRHDPKDDNPSKKNKSKDNKGRRSKG